MLTSYLDLAKAETTSCVHEDSETSNSFYNKTLIYAKCKWEKILWEFPRDSVVYPDIFSYHWKGMGTQKLSPNFLQQRL